MADFNADELMKVNDHICGREIKEVRINDDRMDSFLEISLKDGGLLRFRYDYIYEFDIQ